LERRTNYQPTKKIMKKIILISVFFVLGFNPAEAATLAVPGNYATIQGAVNAAGPGDTVLVSLGTYNERVNISKSGSTGNLITVEASGNVEMKGFYITGDYVEVINFIIKNSPDTGVDVWASNCVVKHNKISYVYNQGVQVFGNNNLVEGNDISHVLLDNDDADGIRFFGNGNILRDNYIHDIYQTEAGLDAHVDCFQTFGGSWPAANNTIVEGNICMNDKGHSSIGHQCLIYSSIGRENSGLIYRNNVCQAQTWSGVLIFSPGIPGVEIYNNVFLDSIRSQAIYVEGPQPKIYNNIFALRSGAVPYNGAGVSSALLLDYNLWNIGTLNEPHGISNRDPLFVDQDNLDYSVMDDSPACGNGLNGVDIGAYPCGDKPPLPPTNLRIVP
jgi:hypothetical protein